MLCLGVEERSWRGQEPCLYCQRRKLRVAWVKASLSSCVFDVQAMDEVGLRS